MAVRNESVRLTLEDAGYSTNMAKATAATMMLDQALEALDGSNVRVHESTTTTSKDVDRLSDAAVRGSSSIDQYSGRLRILAEAVATLGPGLLAIGAGGVTGLAALAGLFGAGAVSALGMAVAVQGLGDAVKAVEKARLEPTVDNLRAADAALAQLSPRAQEFVARFEEIRPVLRALRDSPAEGFFPGLTESLDDLEKLQPVLSTLLEASGRAGGDAIAGAAESLTTERWAPFLDFLTDEIPQAVDSATRILGSLAHAGTEIWRAFDPTNDRFIDWLSSAADGLDDWASSEEGRQDIRDFLAYVEETGPSVRDFFVAVADALTQVVQAAAPLSGPVLETLTAVSRIVANIADSDLGTPILTGVAALTLYTRSLQAATAMQSKLFGTGAAAAFASQGAFGYTRTLAKDVKSAVPSMREFGQVAAYMGQSSKYASEKTLAARASVRAFSMEAARTAVPLAGIAVAASGVADGMAFSNTASLALMGTIAGPWGAAIGGGIGLMIDLANASNQYAGAQERANAALQSNNVEQITAAIAEQQEILKNARDSDKVTGVGDFFSDLQRGLSGHGTQEERDDAEAKLGQLKEALGSAHLAADQLADTQARVAADRRISEWAQSVGADMFQLSQDIKAPELSLISLEDQMRNQGRAAADMGRNIGQAIRNGANPEAIKQLVDELGADAGLALEQLARGGEKAANRFNASFRRSKAGTDLLASNIDNLARKVSRFPNLTIRAGLEGAAAVEAAIGQLTRPRLVRITASTNANVADAYVNRADGGTIPGPRHPYGDKVLAYLAPGEEVITNRRGEADRFRADRAAGRIPAYANGGTVQTLSVGGAAKTASPTKLGALQFAGLPALNLATMSLKQLNKALKASEKALEKEKDQREAVISKMTEVRSAVSGRVTSDLFGETDVWTSGGTVADAIGTNLADIRKANLLAQQIAILKSKGLDGPALDELLSKADDATLANFVGASKADLSRYESSFEIRAGKAAATGASAAGAAYGPDLTIANRELKQLNARVARLTKVTEAEHDKDRKAKKRGAGSGRRSTKRG